MITIIHASEHLACCKGIIGVHHALAYEYPITVINNTFSMSVELLQNDIQTRFN